MTAPPPAHRPRAPRPLLFRFLSARESAAWFRMSSTCLSSVILPLSWRRSCFDCASMASRSLFVSGLACWLLSFRRRAGVAVER